jgi:CheY-like chemotaxis protein
MVVGDAMRLRQVVINLVSNACKFTPTGKVEVDASIEEGSAAAVEDKERFTLVLHVRDTGIGIAPDQIHLVFDAFEQADRSDSRRYGGTGLGLAICRNLTRLMGGEIQVNSKLNEGSDFRIRIPMRRAPQPDALEHGQASSPEPLATEPSAFRPLRILAAEDNRINRILLGRILEQAGHHADFAGDGAETLRMWEQGGYDLLLMDLQMPVMDGLETTKEIRRRETGTGRRTPIIAVTARAMHEDRDLTIAAGMDGYVSKPYSKEDILAAIQRARPASNGKSGA